MSDFSTLEHDAVSFATRAVKCDQEGLVDTAIFYYREAAQALLSAFQSGSANPGLQLKAAEYLNRAEQLRTNGSNVTCFTVPGKTPQQLELERARFLVQQAFDEDEGGNTEEAFELYTQAADICIKVRQSVTDKDVLDRVTRLAMQALERAEAIKKAADTTSDSPIAPNTAANSTKKVPLPGPLGFSLREDVDKAGSGAHPGHPTGGGRGHHGPTPPSNNTSGYTKEEIAVIRTTSKINERSYVPFMSVDMKERFGFPVPFSDKDGKLALSPKQREQFGKWERPEDYMDNPQMIYAVSSFSIKQTIVSDCSFVASLAISAQYERKFHKKLITSLIYPQNRKGEPQYNPCGKYMVKLNINGVLRKIIIDDYLPVSRDGRLLCSYSNNKNELWVSLLEKAYLKVMGGYDFPGSNSNIDLHALTGWIPERVSIRPGSQGFDANKEFMRMMDRFTKGHCLITMATGEISQAEADRAGLVPTHAYAMLDIRIVKGIKILQLKNPWSHLSWKGNYSEQDVTHWTEDMKKALNYDPKTAGMIDNGVFWIDYESLLKFYDVMYINWNPDLFAHTTCYHHTWTAKDGPKKDSYNIGDNPQYRLQVKGSGAVWMLLSRHITDKDDFANNKEFIALLVYKSSGKRIFYPYDPPPYKDGVRINSPHYLCKMVEDQAQTFTVVISQYEKSTTTHYTLRVYATCQFSLDKISEPYNPKYEKQVTGAWKGITAGGCGNYKETYTKNPNYQMKIDNNRSDNQVMVELKGSKEFSVGFEILLVSENVSSPGSFKKKSSGDFRRGFSVLELDNLPGGIYNIRPCTFKPGQESPFFLSISASVPVTLAQLHV